MERHDDVIELGVASVETQGAIGGSGDEVQLRRPTGISED